MVELNFETIGVNINSSNGKAEEVATPKPICNDMAALFDYTDCNKKIWADLYCKTGNPLEAVINNGVSNNNIMAICGNQQSQMLVCRKIYHKLLTVVEIDTSNIRGLESYKITRMGQIYYVGSTRKVTKSNGEERPFIWQDAVTNNEAYRIITEIILKEMEKTMSLEWETTDNFGINNVIMNPPYTSSDIQLDFVTLAHKVSKNNVVAIIPAKWQAKQDDATAKNKVNDNFRTDIVPYMSSIVMYRNSHDVFDVDENAGISYFSIDSKKKHPNKNVKNICNNNIVLNSEFEVHDEVIPVLYNTDILQILGKVGQLGEGFKQSLYVKNKDWGEKGIADTLGFKRCIFVGEKERGEALKQAGCVEVVQGETVTGYKKIEQLKTTINMDKYKCTCSCMMGYGAMLTGNKDKVLGSPYINVLKPYQVPKGSFPVLKYFDTEFEAKSFRSYIQSKTCSLLFYAGICGATVTSSFFRFIPDQSAYDKLYEDEPLPGYTPDKNGEYTDNQGIKHCSLYIKYEFTDKDINIIESIIKERD
jgi:hypothetical protein